MRRGWGTIFGALAAAACTAAFACGSFSGSAEPAKEGGTSEEGGTNPGGRFCPPDAGTAQVFVCADYDQPDFVGSLSFIDRVEGEGAGLTISQDVGASPPSSLRVVLGPAGGRAQRTTTFTAQRDELGISLRVYLAGPTTTPVRVINIENATPSKTLALVIDGTALGLLGPTPKLVDGGSPTTLIKTTYNLSPGKFTTVTLKVSNLDSSSNISLGVDGNSTKRIDNTPTVGSASTVAIGGETAGPNGAAELFIDDVVITSR